MRKLKPRPYLLIEKRMSMIRFCRTIERLSQLWAAEGRFKKEWKGLTKNEQKELLNRYSSLKVTLQQVNLTFNIIHKNGQSRTHRKGK
jgi:hypothetical protein